MKASELAHLLGGTLEVVGATNMSGAQHLGPSTQQGLGNMIHMMARKRRLVHAVSAEELVGTLARKHRLHAPRSQLVDEVQRHG